MPTHLNKKEEKILQRAIKKIMSQDRIRKLSEDKLSCICYEIGLTVGLHSSMSRCAIISDRKYNKRR